MDNPNDRDHERPGHNQARTANFNQQGQQVNGPQYNAEQINFSESVSPDVIAEGLRRYHEPPPPPRQGLSSAEIQLKREEEDLRVYGYRHYSRDKKSWLQSLTPQERRNEQRRESYRKKYGKMPWHRHQQILRAGKLPPETSPANPRYVQAKREVERKEDKRKLHSAIAGIVVMLTLILIAILDDALWFVAILGFAMTIGVVSGYRKRRVSGR
jgi:hypothetical protein